MPFTSSPSRRVLETVTVVVGVSIIIKCNTKSCKCNRSNTLMHDKFTELLDQLKKQLEMTWNNLVDTSANDSKSMIAKLSDLKDKLEKVDDRFAVGEIDRPIYEKAIG